jgi:hypothetical protein
MCETNVKRDRTADRTRNCTREIRPCLSLERLGIRDLNSCDATQGRAIMFRPEGKAAGVSSSARAAIFEVARSLRPLAELNLSSRTKRTGSGCVLFTRAGAPCCPLAPRRITVVMLRKDERGERASLSVATNPQG